MDTLYFSDPGETWPLTGSKNLTRLRGQAGIAEHLHVFYIDPTVPHVVCNIDDDRTLRVGMREILNHICTVPGAQTITLFAALDKETVRALPIERRRICNQTPRYISLTDNLETGRPQESRDLEELYVPSQSSSGRP